MGASSPFASVASSSSGDARSHPSSKHRALAPVRLVDAYGGSSRYVERYSERVRAGSFQSPTGLAIYGNGLPSIHSEYPDNASQVRDSHGWARLRTMLSEAERPDGIVSRMRDAVLGPRQVPVYDGSVRHVCHAHIITSTQLAWMLSQHSRWLHSHGRRGKRFVLRDASLHGLSLAGAMLRDSIISDCDLSCCDLAGAVLMGAKLDGCDMTRRSGITMSASVSGSMRGCDMRGVHLTGCDMSVTEMSGSDMRGSVLVGCKLHGCDLSRVSFAGAVVDGCDLTMTMMRGTTFGNSVARDCDLDGAIRCGRRAARVEGLADGKVRVIRPIAVWDVPTRKVRHDRTADATGRWTQGAYPSDAGDVWQVPTVSVSHRLEGGTGYAAYDEWDDLD